MESVETNGRQRNSGATWRISSNACNIQKPSTLTVMSVRVLLIHRYSRLVVVGYRTTRQHTRIGVLPRPVLIVRPSWSRRRESVLDMLLPAVCTFWPWELACS